MPSIPRLFGLRAFASLSAAVRHDAAAAAWTQAPLTVVRPATADESLFHVTVDVSDSPDLPAAHTAAGQYLQIRIPGDFRAPFFAIASPPSLAASRSEFHFLVKRVTGSTNDALCGLRIGDLVELSGVFGRGFQVDLIPPHNSLLIFATGSGISPIRSLIESGFGGNKRPDVRLYYGARNLERMAYQDRFNDWESSGVRIIPVLSRPDGRWKGECGNVQVLILMRNLTVNLTSPDFEDHRKLIASYDPASREVVKYGSANNSIKADETMNPLVVAAPEPATAAATTATAAALNLEYANGCSLFLRRIPRRPHHAA